MKPQEEKVKSETQREQEQRIIRGVKRKDPEALKELYQVCRPRFEGKLSSMRIPYFKSGIPPQEPGQIIPEGEGIIHEAYRKIIDRIQNPPKKLRRKRIRNLRAYAGQTAFKTAITSRNPKGKQKRNNYEISEEIPDEKPTPEQITISKQTQQILNEAVEKTLLLLTPFEQKLVREIIYEGKKPREIAKEYRIEKKQVNTPYNRFNRNFRKEFESKRGSEVSIETAVAKSKEEKR